MVKCNQCNKKAIASFPYSGMDLCGNCFTKLFEKRVSKAVRDFNLIQTGDRIAVGVSGGKDSSALLFTLWKLCKKIYGVTLVPILVDEGIQGYRSEALKKAEKLCEKVGLKLEIVTYAELYNTTMDKLMKNKAKMKKKGVEWKGSCGYCGVFRRTALNLAAKKLKCNKVAIGHNADDVAQTVLMNFMRNEPVRFRRFGVMTGAIENAGFVKRIKPLIYITEREAALYCVVKELPFHLAECPYSDESFRGEVKDFLNTAEAAHPGTKQNIVSSFLSLRESIMKSEKIEETKGYKPVGHCKECGEPTSREICKACEYKEEIKNATS